MASRQEISLSLGKWHYGGRKDVWVGGLLKETCLSCQRKKEDPRTATHPTDKKVNAQHELSCCQLHKSFISPRAHIGWCFTIQDTLQHQAWSSRTNCRFTISFWNSTRCGLIDDDTKFEEFSEILQRNFRSMRLWNRFVRWGFEIRFWRLPSNDW